MYHSLDINDTIEMDITFTEELLTKMQNLLKTEKEKKAFLKIYDTLKDAKVYAVDQYEDSIEVDQSTIKDAYREIDNSDDDSDCTECYINFYNKNKYATNNINDIIYNLDKYIYHLTDKELSKEKLLEIREKLDNITKELNA